MDFNIYQSPFSWRYGSDDMRRLWSETNKRKIWRQIWVAIARAQSELGLVQPDQVDDLVNHKDDIDINRSLYHESQIHHDLVAEVKTYAEQCKIGGAVIHSGATSMDVKDNADILLIQQSLDSIIAKLKDLLLAFSQKIETYAATPVIAFTHLQPAEPTTLGYRFANSAQDLLLDWQAITSARDQLRGKGFKGAVGTAASYMELLGSQNFLYFEERLSEMLGIPFFPVTTQTYPRKQDYQLLSALSGLGASLYKLAYDVRLLQSQPIGEIQEPFGEKQVGSSAMPFKRNPINAEKINSLARMLSQLPQLAWQNAAHSHLERTLDDSANRRAIIPEAFLISDEILDTSLKIIQGMAVNNVIIQNNLSAYAPFANTERLLMALVKNGADRQEMHEVIRRHSTTSWQAIIDGQQDNLAQRLANDAGMKRYLTGAAILAIMQTEEYTGYASQWALETVEAIKTTLADYPVPD